MEKKQNINFRNGLNSKLDSEMLVSYNVLPDTLSELFEQNNDTDLTNMIRERNSSIDITVSPKYPYCIIKGENEKSEVSILFLCSVILWQKLDELLNDFNKCRA